MDPQKMAALKALMGLRDGAGKASMSHLMPEEERGKHSITILFGPQGELEDESGSEDAQEDLLEEESGGGSFGPGGGF
jgi:hypothetical protein